MTLEWIPLQALEPHPENANVMPEHLLAKLKAHLARTGRYEPLVVRPLPGAGEPPRGKQQKPRPVRAALAQNDNERGGSPHPPRGAGEARYQILNGHHRARVLADLGHTHARCDVWEVDDNEARLLLATLNRLEGRDDPSRRAALVARLAEGPTAADLARLLPEPAEALERLKKLADPPPAPTDPSATPLPRAMTFFLDEGQETLVCEALRAAASGSRESSHDLPGATGARSSRDRLGGAKPSAKPPEVAGTSEAQQDARAPKSADATGTPDLTVGARKTSRADALARLAEWYLEARGRR